MDFENYNGMENASTEKFCRLCFMHNDLLINFSEKVANDGLMISDVLVKNLGLELSDGELPELVCCDCLEEVVTFNSIRPDVKDTLRYMISRAKYLAMSSIMDQETKHKPCSIKQDVDYPHENCSPSVNGTHQRFFKKVLHAGGNSNYAKQTSVCNIFYQCRKCEGHLVNVDDLNRHVNIFHSKDKYVCGGCERRFKTRKKLVKHIKKYDFSCVAKGCRMKEEIKSSSEESVTIVINSILEKKAEEEVLKSSNPSLERKPSIVAKEYNDCKRSLCPLCGALFAGDELPKGHLSDCLRAADEENKNLPTKLYPVTSSHATNITSNPNNVDHRIRYKCGKCYETFPDRNHVICHLKDKHDAQKPFMCWMCNVGFCSRLELGVHQSVHYGEKLYTCLICGLNMHHKYHFERHITRCQNRKAFKCNICDKSFMSARELKVHSYIHSSERKFSCEYCFQRFRSSNGLHMHIKAVHLKLKPYECGICKQAFISKQVLGKHISRHSDERPFVCKVCNRSFKVKYPLTRHMKCVHASKIKVANNIAGSQQLTSNLSL